MKKSLMAGVFLCSIHISFAQTDSAEVYFQQGIEHKAAKRFMLAAKALDKAVAFDPALLQAYLENGYVQLEMRKTDEAIRQFSKVVELNPSNTQAINELMELYFNYHQYSKAKEMAAKCNSCTKAEKIIALCNYHDEDYA